MTTYTEIGTRIGDLLKRELEPIHNRETVTITQGQSTLVLGSVLGRVDGTGDTGEYSAWDPAASDGRQTVRGILLEDDTLLALTATMKAAILARGPAVIAKERLVYSGGITAAQKVTAEAELEALGIVCRHEAAGDPVSIS